ncbi:MAG: hypothetical protein JXM79_00290 [Sedimentisphaerales bacterium]|nr:hypothetical protein [Sedimentisphaerales bacterium]
MKHHNHNQTHDVQVDIAPEAARGRKTGTDSSSAGGATEISLHLLWRFASAIGVGLAAFFELCLTGKADYTWRWVGYEEES